METKKIEILTTPPHVKWAFVRTVCNVVIIVSDMLPIFAIPGSIIEGLNIVSVLANRIGIKLPNLTPNVNNGILGTGIVGGFFDAITLELLPFPSSLLIHGAQILHDIRPIHEHIQENPKLRKLKPATEFVYNVSMRLLRNS
jgi:hypothetical protein